MKKAVLLFIIVTTLLVPTTALAIELNLEYPTFGGINLEKNQSLSGIVAWLYALIVGISGLAAFVMIVWGGVQWMTSAGDPTKTSDAKDRIKKALLGLLLILASFVILRVINPELTTLRIIGLPTIECPKDDEGKCIPFEPLQITGEEQQVVLAITPTKIQPGATVTISWLLSEAIGQNLLTECTASGPPALEQWWDGEQEPTGNPINTSPISLLGVYEIKLTCETEFIERVGTAVLVVSDEPTPADTPDPDVVVEIAWGDASTVGFFNDTSLEESQIPQNLAWGEELLVTQEGPLENSYLVRWTTENTFSCILSSDRQSVQEEADQSETRSYRISDQFTGTPSISFTVKCFNVSGMPAEDTVTIRAEG